MRWLTAILFFSVVLSGCSGQAEWDSRLFSQGVLVAGEEKQEYKVWIAKSTAARQQGWQYKENLGANEGMVFVFPESENAITPTFHMRNVRWPLDIVFLYNDNDCLIDEIVTLQPGIQTHTPAKTVRQVVEMPAGWFAKNNLGPGDCIMIK